MDGSQIGRRGLLAVGVAALAGAAVAAERKPDLGDRVAGDWHGDVISDSKGPSKSGVTLHITRTGPNTVRIESDYSRLPVVSVRLELATHVIVNRGGDTAFSFNPATGKLDVSFHNEVSWSGSMA